MTWQLALAVAAALFGAVIVWRVRPSFGPRRAGKDGRAALAAARARILTAATPAERALALCDAGDARAAMGGRLTGALGYYLRAMRSDPTAAAPVVRAAQGLARRPRMLESLLWRRLGSSAWDGPNRASAIAALAELERVYARSLRNRSRANAMRFAHALLQAPEPKRD
jgi:hypothetical protein